MSFATDLKQIMSLYRHNEEANMAVKEVLNLVDLHFARTISEVKSKGLKSAAGAVSGEATSLVSAIMKIFRAYPDPLQASLQETAGAIFTNIQGNLSETLKDLRGAQENGLSSEEHIVLLVNHHLPELLAKHPEADADLLRKDLLTLTAITESILLADMRGKVDRLISQHKQEAHND